MFRVVNRETLNDDEVQPYQEMDLNRVADAVWEGDEERETSDPVDLSALGALFVLGAAQEKAQEILAQARQQAQELQHEASGQGMARGLEEGKKKLLPSLIAFAEAGQALIVLEEQLVSRLTPQLVRLALEIAEKIVGKTVEEEPEIVASVLSRAKAEIPHAKLVRIWLHPTDHELLLELRPDLVRAGQEGGRRIEVLTSEEISRGGCRVETEIGLVEATLPTQVEEIRRQMLDEEPQLAISNQHSAVSDKKLAEDNDLNGSSSSSGSSSAES